MAVRDDQDEEVTAVPGAAVLGEAVLIGLFVIGCRAANSFFIDRAVTPPTNIRVSLNNAEPLIRERWPSPPRIAAEGLRRSLAGGCAHRTNRSCSVCGGSRNRHNSPSN
jgi:hypothetical protein